MTYLELAKLSAGARVRFVKDYDRNYPHVYVKAGETGTVVEQGLNELQPALLVRLDDPEQQARLADWDGVLWFYGPEQNDSPEWNNESGVELV